MEPVTVRVLEPLVGTEVVEANAVKIEGSFKR
jgi:hypothetical protein